MKTENVETTYALFNCMHSKCPFSTNHPESMIEHIRWHFEDHSHVGTLICSHCHSEFNDAQQLVLHIQADHRNSGIRSAERNDFEITEDKFHIDGGQHEPLQGEQHISDEGDTDLEEGELHNADGGHAAWKDAEQHFSDRTFEDPWNQAETPSTSGQCKCDLKKRLKKINL